MLMIAPKDQPPPPPPPTPAEKKEKKKKKKFKQKKKKKFYYKIKKTEKYFCIQNWYNKYEGILPKKIYCTKFF